MHTSITSAAVPMIKPERVFMQHNNGKVSTIRKFSINLAMPGVDPPRDKALQELGMVS